ncbi:GNAT family N-acetyltransferase [Neisseria sp. Ec49-e6-T10]|uniref:GNAT family N-acetyltransferase n=1 Tax=Neisseria sp. Ec49-e6-T10 TaxID=3140744 RepID=UPI003EBA28D7
MSQSTASQARTNVGMPIHIETNGYILRSLTVQDVSDRFLTWLNDPKMMEGLNLAHVHFSFEQLQAFVQSFNNLNNYLIGIFDQTNGLLVGFYTLDIGLAHKVGNITTGIGEPEYQGRGVLWATIDALLDHFYTYRDIDKITARVIAKNRKMLFNFINNTRFVFEARLRKECLSVAGERMDVMVFASFKEPLFSEIISKNKT